MSSSILSRAAGVKSELSALRALLGLLALSYRPDSNPCASGLCAMISRPWSLANARSASASRLTRLYATWLLRMRLPSEFSALAPAGQGVVADADLCDQSILLEATHLPHDGAVPNQRVRPVHLVEVQPGDPEAAGARRGALRQPESRRQDRMCLRGQENRCSVISERLAEDALALAVAIDRGSVKKRDAQLDRPTDDEASLVLGIESAVTPRFATKLASAKANLGDLLPSPDFPVQHDSWNSSSP